MIKRINEAKNVIVVESLKPYEKVKNPALIKGKARGYFFFEANFHKNVTNVPGTFVTY